MKRTYFLLSVVILLSACSKGSDRKTDRDAPVVTITTPVNDQSFPVGSTMNVTGAVTHAGKIVQVHIHFSSLTSGQLLLDVHRYPGTENYTLAESIQIPSTGEFRLQVIARDNAGNEGRKTVVVNGN